VPETVRRSFFPSPSPSVIIPHQQTRLMEERPLPPAPKSLTVVLAILFALLGIWVVWVVT
jgi:hypothetical protein